jgi:hypothetical protein
MLGDIDLIFGIWVYNDELQIKFTFHSGPMIFGRFMALGLWNLAKYLVVTTLLYPRSPKGEGGILFYSVHRRIFLSNCWWQKSDFWSQASYRYTILWVAFLDPSDSYFLFADFVDFYTHWKYMLIFRHIFSQQLLMAEIWYLVTGFI